MYNLKNTIKICHKIHFQQQLLIKIYRNYCSQNQPTNAQATKEQLTQMTNIYGTLSQIIRACKS